MSSSSSSSSNSPPCAACKTQRRKCTQECVFAPYFPPDNQQMFLVVQKVFGASNVAKLLNDLEAADREDAVKSLAYEAAARLKDPVYGCVGLISLLQHKLKQLTAELNQARTELANYAAVANPALPQPPNGNGSFSVFSLGPAANPGPTVQGMMSQQDLWRFEAGSGSGSGSGLDNGHVGVSPSLALGPPDQCPYQYPLQQQFQAHLMLSPPPQPLHHPKFESNDGRTSWTAGPSSCC